MPPALLLDFSIVNGTPGYVALREHAAWLDLSSRGKIRITGEDRARLLHAMSTNHVQGLKPGQGCYTFFLNAQGRILGDANILCFEDHFILDTESELRAKIFEHLDRYIIADDVALEDVTEKLSSVSIEGPESAEALARLGAPVPMEPFSIEPWGSGHIARIDTTGSGGFLLLFPLGEMPALDIPAATADDARTMRIENGKPRYGEEITERYLVQETGQMGAVHSNKGCYLGQEIVERVRSRAQIHRQLRSLEIDTSNPPATGTKLKAGDAEAAEIVSAAFSPALERTVALAYVRSQFAEPGTELTLDSIPARVI